MKRAILLVGRALPALILLLLGVAPAEARRLDVELWTDRGEDAVYQPGDAMQVKVRTTDDAYLLVYEIDADGNVRVLFPWKRSIGFVEARRTYRLPPEDGRFELVVERSTGQGFLVAIASREPFQELPWYLRPYDPQAEAVGYEGAPDKEEGFDEDGRVVGDPYVAMERIRRRVTRHASDEEMFASSYASYYVHEQVRYPRYLCYDCHRPGMWRWWDGFDPYYTTCNVFDFRVNWAWSWGPPIWQSCVPYYYYVVRHDCPPRYRPYYEQNTRWSAWDGWKKWDNLSGGNLRRYKQPAAPPVGYVPPPPKGEVWRKGEVPPGIIPVSKGDPGYGNRPLGFRKPAPGGDDGARPRWRVSDPPGRVPASREKPEVGARAPWRVPGGKPDVTPMPAREGRDEQPSPRWEPAPRERESERPRVQPPRQDPPDREPRSEPPRVDPPRHEPPRQGPPHREPPHRDPPHGKAERPSKGDPEDH